MIFTAGQNMHAVVLIYTTFNIKITPAFVTFDIRIFAFVHDRTNKGDHGI